MGIMKLRVLVVDDNSDDADSLALFLRLKGYEVRCAYDGPSGLTTALEFGPDVALLDLQIPKLNGLQLVARLWRECRWLVMTVAVSAYSPDMLEPRYGAVEGLFTAYLVKPTDSGALSKLLEVAKALKERRISP